MCVLLSHSGNDLMDEYTLERLADFICGDDKQFAPEYRSSWYLTRFFEGVGLSRFRHDGSTRKWWVLGCLKQCNDDELQRVILGLSSPKTYGRNSDKIKLALKSLNEILAPEGYLVKLDGVTPSLEKTEPYLVYAQSEMREDTKFQMNKPDFNSLVIDKVFALLLSNRWDEIGKCLESNAFLASTILMGSLLEGTLYGVLSQFPEKASRVSASPKYPKTDKPKPIYEWSLRNYLKTL